MPEINYLKNKFNDEVLQRLVTKEAITGLENYGKRPT